MRTHVSLSGLLAAVLAASAVLTAQAAPRPPDTFALGAAAPTVDWRPCPDAAAVQCGTMRVPMDWTRPDGAQVTLAVARRLASDSSRRIGTLFYNHGGPGESAVEYIVHADVVFSRTLRDRFDLVGMDPRAVGGSARVTCAVPLLAPDVTLFPRTPAQFDRLRQHNREVGLSCLNRTGPLLGHVDTVTVARDHDALRQALGEDRVSWLGLSYGTQLAANYAELYPRRTRAMVLDAALEHSLPEVVQVADEAMAAEDSFNRFLAWCRTASSCALRGKDVGSLYDRLVARADRDPLRVEGALRPVTGEDIRLGTIGLLRFKEPSIFGPDLSWPGLSRAIDAALQGDARAFALPPPTVPEDSPLIPIGCQEYQPQVTSFAQMRQRIRMGRELAPHLRGATETWQVNRCIDWPVPPANPPRALDVRGVPALIVHATHDPSVPYKWAHSLAAQIAGSAILTRIGDGHTSSHTSRAQSRRSTATWRSRVRRRTECVVTEYSTVKATVVSPRTAGGRADTALVRFGAVSAVLGIALEVAMETLHPSGADPNDSPAAFAEYARSGDWAYVHIGQFLGTVLIVIALVVISRPLARQPGAAGALADIGAVTAVLVAAVFAVQMAVDGVALKAAVDTWAGASSSAERSSAFGVAESVRSVEKGLSSFFHLSNGLTLLALGLSATLGRRLARWLGAAGALAGAAFLVGGVMVARTDFSAEANRVLLPALLLSAVFLIGAPWSLSRTGHDSG